MLTDSSKDVTMLRPFVHAFRWDQLVTASLGGVFDLLSRPDPPCRFDACNIARPYRTIGSLEAVLHYLNLFRMPQRFPRSSEPA